MNKSDWLLRIIINSLTSFIIANPFIHYFLSGSIILSIMGICIAFIIISFVNNYFRAYKWLYVYIINFIVIISIFFHFEAAFRYFYPEYIIKDLYSAKSNYFFNKPNLNEYLIDKEYKTLYRTNNQGFRIGKSTSSDKEIKKCDWLFLGDSFTQGAQVEFNQLFTSFLYKHFPDKSIVNVGISGFGIAEEYYLYQELGSRLKPKKVFLQLSNFNDFMNVEVKSRSISDYLMQYSDLFRFLIYGLKFKKTTDLPLGRWTEPFYPTEQANIDYNIFYKKTSKKKEADIRSFKKYFKKLNDEINRNGAEMILIILPTREEIYPSSFTEVIEGFDIDVNSLDMNKPRKILNELACSLDVKVIDLTDQYKTYPGNIFFENDEHLNVYGHALTASLIANELRNGQEERKIRVVGSVSTANRYPSYSNDRENIIFQGMRDGNYEIIQADSDYTKEKRLTSSEIDELHPIMSPNKSRIAYTQGNPDSLKSKVAIMDVANGGYKLITKKPNQFGAIPAFSRDGKLVAYAQWYFNEEEERYTLPQIVYCDLNGENEVAVTNNDYEHWRPIFSPDSKSIIYISRRNGNFDIYETYLDKRKEINLTNTLYDEWDSNISPAGDKIVFASYQFGNWDLYEMERDGRNKKRLTDTIGDEWDPSYSQDGNSILFAGEFGFLGGIYEMSLEIEAIYSAQYDSQNLK